MASCLGPGGAPSLALPSLAAPAGDTVDAATLFFVGKAAVLAQAELDKRKTKEAEEKEVARHKEVHAEVQQQAAVAMEGARLLLERNKRKWKKRRKRKLLLVPLAWFDSGYMYLRQSSRRLWWRLRNDHTGGYTSGHKAVLSVSQVASGFRAFFTCETVRSSLFHVASLGVSQWW